MTRTTSLVLKIAGGFAALVALFIVVFLLTRQSENRKPGKPEKIAEPEDVAMAVFECLQKGDREGLQKYCEGKTWDLYVPGALDDAKREFAGAEAKVEKTESRGGVATVTLSVQAGRAAHGRIGERSRCITMHLTKTSAGWLVDEAGRLARSACINNMRMVETGKDSYATERGGTNGTQLLWDDICPFVRDLTNSLYCPAAPIGRRGPANYSMNAIGVDCSCLIIGESDGHSVTNRP